MEHKKQIYDSVKYDEISFESIEKLITSPGKKLVQGRRKRKKLPSTSEDENETQIDKTIELKLQECAKKNNIAPIEMKKILRKIVRNDHVLALVKIQEEAELAQEEKAKTNIELLNENDEHENFASVPKLTRSKYRQLHNDRLAIPLFNETDPEQSEVVALISEELHTDDEDDEYEPKEEDFISEDDLNATTSDIESQPRTPMTPISHFDIDSPKSLLKSAAGARFTSDGLFKLPRERYDSITSQQEEIIAKRTRSKLCLEDTAIETIESTFIPPDITSDMYDFDVEMDQAWMEFLSEFTRPLNNTLVHEEDDPVADPEYIAADKIPLDAEELRDVNISKKELSDLVNELFDGLVQDGVITDDGSTDLETPKKSTYKNTERSSVQSPQRKKSKLISSNQQQVFDEALNLPVVNSDYYSENCNNSNISTFQPNVMSTPGAQLSITNVNTSISGNLQETITVCNSSNVHSEQNSQLIVPVTNSMISDLPLNHSNSLTSQNTMIQNSNSNIYANSAARRIIAFPVPGAQVPCYQIAQISPKTTIPPISFSSLGQTDNNQPIFARIANQFPSSYIDITQPSTPTQTCNEQIPKSKKKSSYISHPDYFEMWKGDAHNSAVKYYNKFYENKYKDLHNEIEFTENFKENQIGFTTWQRQILDQQMRIHVQLTTQNYLQIYSHPQFWKLAKDEKDMLFELNTKKNGNENSAFNAVNLQEALHLVQDWENELSENTLENQAFMEFIYHEINRNKSTSYYSSSRIFRFPPRTMKKVCQSKIFIYPEYLPRLPFRTKFSNAYQEFTPIESHILAYGLEKYLPEVQNEIKSRPDVYRKHSIIKLTCIKISQNLMLGKTPQRIFEFYKNQLKHIHYNPIKYFNEKKMAPKFHHVLIPINLNNILRPIQRIPELPMIWKEFGTSLKLLEDQRTNAKTTKKLTAQLDEVKLAKERSEKLQKSNKKDAQNVVINLNYIYDNCVSNNCNYKQNLNKDLTSICNENNTTNLNCTIQQNSPKRERCNSLTDYTKVCTRIHDSLNLSPDTDIYLSPYDSENINSQRLSPLKFNNDLNTNTCNINNSNQNLSGIVGKGQKLLTDFYPVNRNNSILTKQSNNDKNKFSDMYKFDKIIRKQKPFNYKRKYQNINYKLQKKAWLRKEFRKVAKNTRDRKKLRTKLQNLLIIYWTYLYKLYKQYKNIYLNKVFINFKSLEIYTDFLNLLKMHCKKANKSSNSDESNSNNKKTKIIDDEAAKLKKANRLSENLRQMLLPENKEESNKKDAIYAFNFYEKVEEMLINSGEQQKFKKFQNILKLFDPSMDKVSDLYYQIEQLFLPNHPDLVQIFLTFLLPSEAVQVGKFFEHFMITNMGTFINKLNIYFNKQPAQIRKIYNSLNDMADDPDLNMDKIKLKILPLLKGNQFLIDWFLQIFPDERPPDSIQAITENVCLKEVESQQDGIVYESLSPKDIIEDNTEAQPCQLRYINGRLFYGSRILLPAKLAFMANSLTGNSDDTEIVNEGNKNMKTNNCVHGIRELAEKRLKLNSLENHSSCDENEKSEDEDKKSEVKSFKLCDESTFRKHAIRLNPSLYSAEDNSMNFYKTNLFDDNSGKSSPKKQLSKSITGGNITTSNPIIKDYKRKSPKKNLPKSPNNTSTKRGPSSSDLSTINVVVTAKKLKSIINDDDNISLIDENKTKKKINRNTKSNSMPPYTLTTNNSTEIKQPKNSDETITNDKVVDVKPLAWTREEDKCILEEAKISQLDGEETLLKRLTSKLKNRTENEISVRHQFLMDLLCKLQKRN